MTLFSCSSLYSSFRVNFKEPEAVRALTCTLLKEDFGLTIDIPLERLIPTVPLRLNYIHWVEDLIDGQKQPRRGIDIGITNLSPPAHNLILNGDGVTEASFDHTS